MALNLRWVGEEDLDRVAETRLRCYAAAQSDFTKFKEGIRADRRALPGDFLLAESGGEAVGTTTSMSLQMWARGARFACQGVAFVGTIRTHRRKGAGDEHGIATILMRETLKKAREREQIVSALMPFRGSFYEHFGYGFAEQRVDWIVPLALMPSGNASGLRFATEADRPAIAACRQRAVERGQCDVETSAASWDNRARAAVNGFEIVDASADGIKGWAYFADERRDEQRMIRIVECAWDSPDGLLRMLQFLGGHRDQYAAAWITLPGDVPLNRLLREPQLPHRPVSHTVAKAEPFTRMQVRILDHKRFLEALHLPAKWSGGATIAVRETEGTVSKFRLDLSCGRATVKNSAATPDVQCTDVIWASIASGDLPARTAAQLRLIEVANLAAIDVLDALSDGPVPYCQEYF